MNKLCEDLGIQYPIFAFSHCRDVIAAVSRAGGMGVFGIVAMSPEEIEVETAWIREHSGGKPFAIDIVTPVSTVDRQQGMTASANIIDDLSALIPQGHRDYAEDLMDKWKVPPLPPGAGSALDNAKGFTAQGGTDQLEAVYNSGAKFLVSALGPPSKDVIDEAHRRGMLVGTLIGKPHQAARSAKLGVDVIIAQSYEAAAHTGEIGSMVLVPDVVDAVGDVPVLAAGGIGSGRQMAAAMALGAQGVWTGSIWLTTRESGTPRAEIDRLLEMASTDTVRSTAQTGKPNRQMRTAWTEAWDDPTGPGALPMPLQLLLYTEYTERARRAGVHELVGSPVGQVVSRMTKIRPAADVLLEIVEEYVETLEKSSAALTAIVGE